MVRTCVMSDTDQKTERFEMRMSAAEIAALDRLRRAENDLPSKADMVRRLILEADAKLKDRKARK